MVSRPRIEAVDSVRDGETGARIRAEVAVVVPTRNASEHVAELLDRLGEALAGRSATVVFADDSDDDTPAQIIARRDATALDIVLRHRPPGRRDGGAGGAVVDCLRAVDASWIVVMDADLHHPPELVAAMVARAESEGFDVVVASRNLVPDPSAEGGVRRRTVTSRPAKALARAAFPRRLAGLSDPTSRMFLLRGGAVDPAELRPRGFSLLLEILGRCDGLAVGEVARGSGARTGRPRPGLAEVVSFLVHVLTLRAATVTPYALRTGRFGRAMLFGAVGLTGLAVNAVAFLVIRDSWDHHYVVAAVGATQVSTLWNFALLEALVFRGPRRGTRIGRLLKFAAFNNLSLLPRVPLLVFFVHLGMGSGVANVLTLVVLFLARFLVADRLIYAVPEGERVADSPVRTVVDLTEPRRVTSGAGLRPRDAYLPYRYSIHGILTIGSEVALPELEYFRASWLVRDFDIEVRRGPVGRLAPRSRSVVTKHAKTGGITYQEHLGRLGANFRVEMGSPIRVTVGPLLQHSPHVLYTNVIEALLRFLFVSKGRMLLHSACLRVGDAGVLVSARTDTGKTGTVLRLVRDSGALFLSDDMTILEPDGLALCFPKPLTISSHTLHALDVSELGRTENLWLKVQSRLHSKGGRSVGAFLGRLNLPIMSVNAITQLVVPPPKYSVDRLVLADLTRCTPIDHAFVIERGYTGADPIDRHALVDELIDNTDDAYGFPPFAYFAPSIVIGDEGYEQLRRRERDILRSALHTVPAARLGSEDFSWSEVIPQLVAAARAGVGPTDQPVEVPEQREPRRDRRTGRDRRAMAPQTVSDASWQL